MRQIVKLLTVIIILNLSLFGSNRVDDLDMLYDDSQVSIIEIEVDPLTLEWIYQYPESDSIHIAQFHFSNSHIDEFVDDIGFRLRGNTSRDALKKSFKISFNTFVPGREFYGVDKLNLNGEHNDPSIVRSKLCWDFYNSVGMVSSRSAHTAVYINGSYYGLYISIEHIDDEFLDSSYNDSSGNLWKCIWPADLTYRGENPEDYHPWIDGVRPYELKTNEELYDYSKLANLISVINNVPDNEFSESLNSVIYVNEFLKYLAVNILMGSWDDYWYLKNNYYLYHEPVADKIHWIPYDYDNSFGIDWFNIEWSQSNPYTFAIMDGERPLATRIMDNPGFRNLYTHFLEFYLGVYSLDTWEDDVLSLRDIISPFAEQDLYRQMDYGFDSDDGLEDFLNSYDADHYSNQHVKRSLFEFRNMRIESLPSLLNYSPGPPMIYDYKILPSNPMAGESLTIEASVFDNDGLTFVQVQYTPDGEPTTLYSLNFNPEIDTKIVEKSDRYNFTISTMPTITSAEIRFIAMDTNGEMSFHPESETINIQLGIPSQIGVRLNEFMAINNNVIMDEEGNYEDWVEIVNITNETIILDGFYLSDKVDNLTKWQFPNENIEIQPDEYLLVWTDNDDEDGPLHTSFELNGSGEFLVITASDGIEIIDSLSFGPQPDDMSMGRDPDGTGEWLFLATPTPGLSNMTIICWAPGDLNCDGTEDILDIVILVDWILTGYVPSPQELSAADLNADGTMDILDIVALVATIL